jgi:hypothetical protein
MTFIEKRSFVYIEVATRLLAVLFGVTTNWAPTLILVLAYRLKSIQPGA